MCYRYNNIICSLLRASNNFITNLILSLETLSTCINNFGYILISKNGIGKATIACLFSIIYFPHKHRSAHWWCLLMYAYFDCPNFSQIFLHLSWYQPWYKFLISKNVNMTSKSYHALMWLFNGIGFCRLKIMGALNWVISLLLNTMLTVIWYLSDDLLTAVVRWAKNSCE